MLKYNFIFDKTLESQKLKKKLKKYKNNSLQNCDLIIVGGGDGFMFRTLKALQVQKTFLWH